MAAVVATSTTAAATASNMPRHVCIAAAAVKGGVEAVGVGAVSARPLLFWVLFLHFGFLDTVLINSLPSGPRAG